MWFVNWNIKYSVLGNGNYYRIDEDASKINLDELDDHDREDYSDNIWKICVEVAHMIFHFISNSSH